MPYRLRAYRLRTYRPRTYRLRSRRSVATSNYKYAKAKRRAKRTGMLTVVPGARGFLQDCVRTRLVYSENISMSPIGTGLSTQQFRINGLFQPNATTSGHQPRYFDQFMTFYNQYHVTGVKVTVKATLDESDDLQAWIALYAHTNDSSWGGPSGINDCIERKAPYRIVTNDGYVTMSAYFSVPKIWGKSRKYVLDDPTFGGTSTANPVSSGLIDILAQNMDLSTVGVVRAVVKLEYDVVFSSPRNIASS